MLKPFLHLLGVSALTFTLAVNPASAAHPGKGEKLADQQELVRANGAEPASIDPQIVEGNVGGFIVKDLMEGLMNSGPEGELEPGVATGWEANEDNTVFTFHLRENARWSDGTPVTASDFVYAWQRAADPATASNYSWFIELTTMKNAADVISGKKPVSALGVSAPDAHTLKVELDQPTPYFPQMTTHYTLFPVNKATIEKYGKAWTKVGNYVGNGAYTLKEWSVNEKIVLERNPQYWDNKHTIINKVTYLPIEDANTDLARWEAHQSHTTFTVPLTQISRLKKQYPDELTLMPQLSNYYYVFNLQKKPFDDVRIRKALSLAIDRDIIVNNITRRGDIPAYTFTPTATAGFNPEMPEYASWTQAERDAEAAKLMKEAGYDKNNPLKFELLYNTLEAHKQIALVISQMWKQKLGVLATPVNQEWKTFLENRNRKTGNFEVGRAGWGADYNEPSTFLDMFTKNGGQNDGKYDNPEYDRLLKEAKTSDDPMPYYQKAEAILEKDVPVIPIFFKTEARMISSQLGGYPAHNPLDNIYTKDMYLKKM